MFNPPRHNEKTMKSFADIHEQVERFNRYAPTGYRWQKIEAIARRYYDNFYNHFGSFDATFANDSVKLPREIYAK